MKVESFTIIVPTHNRSTMVASLLQTLSIARRNFAGAVEVLIIDSSRREEAAKIRSMCEIHKARYLRSINDVAKKRNVGIKQASSEYVLFTDSDCKVYPDILEQHAQVYKSSGDSVGGVLGLTKVTGDTASIWRTIKLDSSFTAAFSFALWLKQAPWGTCTNLSFRKEILLEIGGFDENWPLIIYGEDVDLGLRVTEAGFRIKCNPKAIVEHDSSSISSTGRVLRKKYLSGRADYHLGRRHPSRLSLEFPGWTGMMLLLLIVLALRSVQSHSLLPMLCGAFWLLVGVLFQSIFTAKASGTGWRSISRQAAVVVYEATFEFGRLVEALRHGEIKRLWTKFVYVEQQLLGEREKRIRQMWACIFAFLSILLGGALL